MIVVIIRTRLNYQKLTSNINKWVGKMIFKIYFGLKIENVGCGVISFSLSV